MRKLLKLSIFIYCTFLSVNIFGQSDGNLISYFDEKATCCWKNQNTKEKRNELKDGKWFVENKESSEPNEDDLRYGFKHYHVFSFDETFQGDWRTSGFELGVTIKQLKAAPDAQFGLSLSIVKGSYAVDKGDLHFLINNKNEYDISVFYTKNIYLKKSEKSTAIKANDVNSIKVKNIGANFDFIINDIVVYSYTFEPKVDVREVYVMIEDKASLQILSRYLNTKPDFRKVETAMNEKNNILPEQNNIQRDYNKWGEKKETPIKDGKINGIVKLYYKSGELQVATPFTNDTISGTQKGYYKSGKLSTEIPFTKGKENGISKFYYENGNLSAEIPYTNSDKNGTETAYYESGKLHREMPYNYGKINGIIKSYYENGKLEFETPVTNNISNGVSKYYYENGNLKAAYTYINDNLISTKLFDENGKLKN